MPNPTLSSTFLLSSAFIIIISLSGHPNSVLSAATRRRTNIKHLCSNTTYPGLCIQYLTIVPNSAKKTPKDLAKSALIASLYRAQFTRLHILKVSKKFRRIRDRGVRGDCLELLGDTVDSLCNSILELSKLRRGRGRGNDLMCDDRCHVSNIQTYLSSAVTDASDCVGEFDEFVKRKKMGKVMATVKAKALNVEQATTVALDLFCQFVAACD
ncbi:pectinesterase inhibitor 11-like [Euphorbia lathyris]|uniref:pectinesterase inhibitor 11-like n=1 Tax=Euphorbia lathyris TaxID=212925 RepID=UPI003313AA2D